MVRIAQYLCGPKRHCICAVAFVPRDNEDLAEADRRAILLVTATMKLGVACKLANPVCAICQSPMDKWFGEVQVTRFKTMEEAEPDLERFVIREAIVRAMHQTAYAERN